MTTFSAKMCICLCLVGLLLAGVPRHGWAQYEPPLSAYDDESVIQNSPGVEYDLDLERNRFPITSIRAVITITPTAVLGRWPTMPLLDMRPGINRKVRANPNSYDCRHRRKSWIKIGIDSSSEESTGPFLVPGTQHVRRAARIRTTCRALRFEPNWRARCLRHQFDSSTAAARPKLQHECPDQPNRFRDLDSHSVQRLELTHGHRRGLLQWSWSGGRWRWQPVPATARIRRLLDISASASRIRCSWMPRVGQVWSTFRVPIAGSTSGSHRLE